MTTKKLPEMQQIVTDTILRITIEDKSIDLFFEAEDDALDTLKTLCKASTETDNTREYAFSILRKKTP